MSLFVEILKRNYLTKTIVIEKLDILLSENKITQEEYNYITEATEENEIPIQ